MVWQTPGMVAQQQQHADEMNAGVCHLSYSLPWGRVGAVVLSMLELALADTVAAS